MPRAAETKSQPPPHQLNLKQKASEELKRFLVIFLYLWVVFGLLSHHKSIVLSQHHLDYEEHTFAVINAFVFAKVLLTAEHFRLERALVKNRSSNRAPDCVNGEQRRGRAESAPMARR